MFSEAFASIASAFSDQHGGPFVEAVAVWPGTPVKDDGGSIVSPATPQTYPVRAQFDAATQQMRAAEGFLETDVRILVLSFDRDLTVGAKIVVDTGSHAGTWQVIAPQRDPVGVGWECRGRRIDAA